MRSAIALSLIALAMPGHRASPVVTVIATDYLFDAPAQIPAGLTTIVLVNRGHELHHVQLIRLTDGMTPNDLLHASLTHPGLFPSWAVMAGGPNAPAPGRTSEATVMLEPGSYVMVCVIPGADHVPHIAKGMIRPLTVTPVSNVSDVEPRSDVTLRLTEYAFTLSAPIARGTHTLRVENDGVQRHEAFLVRLAPGKHVGDLVAWADNQEGPPPAEPLGGLTMIPRGAHAYFTQNFTPGRYALLCFVTDESDGQSHVAHGMVKEITVQ